VQGRPLRALLFAPATRPDLFPKAAASGADAIVLDLEDAVAVDRKNEARQTLAETLEPLGKAGIDIFVRINDLTTPWWWDDLAAITRPGLTGVALPKVQTGTDIARVDAALQELERAAGIATGSIDIQPLLETALGIHNAFEILCASARVRSYFGGFARDGDVSRELGARWSPGGEESLYIRSKLLLDGRAAGVAYPISGTWADVHDLEGLARFAEQNRNLGYTGMYVIHPSHVDVVTRAFTPTDSELEWYRRVIEALEGSSSSGDGAVQIDGVMVDKAMAEKARVVLAAHAE
jgi:citrate lyase subunit beta/citryl-CoA lyase